MNTTPHSESFKHSDLTAYALGEMEATSHAEMSAWLEQHPDADAELDRITALTTALETNAEQPTYRLHAHQRQAVLAGPQRVRELVAAASNAQRTAAALRQRQMLRRLGQFAAAATLTLGAFYAGTRVGPPAPAPLATSTKETVKTVISPTPPATVVALGKAPESKPHEALTAAPSAPPSVVIDKPKDEVITPMITAAVAAAKPTQVATPAIITASIPKEPQLITAVAKTTRAPFTRIFNTPFISTAKETVANVTLSPSETRPTPPKTSAPVLGAPLPLSQPNKPVAPRSNKTAELLIHSWKAEVAACPWDESHRLMRLVLQIPGEQPAANSADNTYPLHVNFDPNYVRSYRLLAQRGTTPATMDAAAVHVAWYEITPNGAANEGTARNLGHVTLPGARFTTQAMSPFDGTSLQILDRSARWQNSREDFIFESAVVGFGLLLKGEKDIGQLDHALVLNLAEKSLADDRTGEHAKFVKLVKQAQQSTGL